MIFVLSSLITVMKSDYRIEADSIPGESYHPSVEVQSKSDQYDRR